MSLLELSGLRASYGPVEVLHGIDLRIEEGEIVALLGSNGAGKTTLLRAISRMVYTTGDASFDGRDLSRYSSAKVARLGLGHVPEGRGTFTQLSVEENLRLGLLSRPAALRDRSAEDLALIYATFPILEEFKKREASALSGGQAQMLALGRAILARPRLLLVDEPSLGLAPLTTIALFDQFSELRERWSLTILLAEQNAKLSLKVANRAVVLARGRVALDRSAADLDSEELRASYLGAPTAPQPQKRSGS